MNRTQMFWTGFGLVALAAILASRPTCGRGCRTIAEHIAEHGIDDLMKSFFV